MHEPPNGNRQAPGNQERQAESKPAESSHPGPGLQELLFQPAPVF